MSASPKATISPLPISALQHLLFCERQCALINDVSTASAEGRRRVSRVARACLDFGQRVQNSVFECQVDPAQFAELRHRLLTTMEPNEDSIRFYSLGRNDRAKRRVEHHGIKPSIDLDGPLIV